MWHKPADGPIDLRGAYTDPEGKTHWEYEIGGMIWREPGKPDLYHVVRVPPGGEVTAFFATAEELWPEQSIEWPSDEEIEAAEEIRAARQRSADWYFSDQGTRFRLGGGR
jgi:hypothetical protein